MYAVSRAPAGWLPMVGERVRRLRLERGLSQEALARAAGVNRRSVGRVEVGRSGVHLLTLWRMADGLNVHPADLLAEPGRSRVDQHLAGSDGVGIPRGSEPPGRR
jgi:transcriptional regulator with XRE-family HTH domain